MRENKATGEPGLSAVRHGIFADTKDPLLLEPIYGRQSVSLLRSWDSPRGHCSTNMSPLRGWERWHSRGFEVKPRHARKETE
jgi:hypothetical protein